MGCTGILANVQGKIGSPYRDMTRMGWQVCERLGGRDRGWRVELLVEQLTSKLEQKFLLCCYCSGLMRDACLLEKEGKQEVRCYVCIPEGVTWKPALMNRETNHQRENCK